MCGWEGEMGPLPNYTRAVSLQGFPTGFAVATCVRCPIDHWRLVMGKLVATAEGPWMLLL